MAIIDNIATQALGMMLGDTWGRQQDRYQDARQLEQQRKLQDLQIEGNKQLASYGQELSYDLWKRTNYAAQRNEMQKAGLNVGLMYQQGGPGGTTNHGTAGQVAGAQGPQGHQNVGMGMQLGLQAMLQQAQIENIKANTEKQKVEAAKTAGVDTQLGQATIHQLKAATSNQEALTAVNKWEAQLKELETGRADLTFNDTINQIRESNKILMETYERLNRENKLGDQTYDEAVKQIKNATLEGAARILNIKANTKLTEAETKKAAEMTDLIGQQINMARKENANFWDNFNVQEKQAYVQEQLMKIAKQRADFDTSDANKLKQWTSLITDLIPIVGTGGNRPIGFK